MKAVSRFKQPLPSCSPRGSHRHGGGEDGGMAKAAQTWLPVPGVQIQWRADEKK